MTDLTKPYQIAGTATPSEAETRLIDLVAEFLNNDARYAGLLIITFPSQASDGVRPAMIPMACSIPDASIIMEIASRIDARMNDDIKEIINARKRPT